LFRVLICDSGIKSDKWVNTMNYSVPLLNAAYSNNCFFSRGVNSYNKLSDAVKTMSLLDFKAAI
jgi:hypothetical protein